MKKAISIIAILVFLPACADKQCTTSEAKKSKKALFAAVQSGNAEAVKNYIAASGDVNVTNEYGRTALHRAVIRDCEEIIKLLIENGADVNAADEQGRTALHYAVWIREPDLVSLLVTKGAEVDKHDNNEHTPLDLALKYRYPDVAKTLIELGADARAFTPKSITEALILGDIQRIEDFLAKGNDPNSRGEYRSTPLYYAAQLNNHEIAELLLSHGAHPDSGLPLLKAASRGHVNIVRLLLSHGADTEAQNPFDTFSGRTALQAAVEHNHRETVKTLIDSGADVNARGGAGITALDLAETEEMKQLLLKYGALSGKELQEEAK